MRRIGQLYDVERRSKEWSATEGGLLRQSESVALLHSLSDWLVEQKLRVLPKSPLGQAISNALANWQAFCRHPEDGELSIDNILSERALWAQAVGRNNWLFVGSDDGGRTATVLFSITASASDTASTPSATWRTVLQRLPTTPPDRRAGLLPDVWFQAHPNTARKRAA